MYCRLSGALVYRILRGHLSKNASLSLGNVKSSGETSEKPQPTSGRAEPERPGDFDSRFTLGPCRVRLFNHSSFLINQIRRIALKQKVYNDRSDSARTAR